MLSIDDNEVLNAITFQSPSEVSDVLSVSRKNTLNKLLKAALFSPPSSDFQKSVFRRFSMSLRSHTALSLPFFHPSIPAYRSTKPCNPCIGHTKDDSTNAEEGPGEKDSPRPSPPDRDFFKVGRDDLHHVFRLAHFPVYGNGGDKGGDKTWAPSSESIRRGH